MNKRWVIPDIHGCSKTLKALFDHYISPSKDDVLYFVGDYIDRGPDSKGVIDYLMQLQQEGFRLHLLKGNPEESFVKSWQEEHHLKSFLGLRSRNASKAAWKRFGGKQSMKSFGTNDLQKIPAMYAEWLDGLPTHMILDNYVLVHAGLNFDLDDPFEDQHAMLWTRGYDLDRDKIGRRTLIHGHVPVDLETIFTLRDQMDQFGYIDLDNGIYMAGRNGFGNLVALELNSLQLYSQYNLDMK